MLRRFVVAVVLLVVVASGCTKSFHGKRGRVVLVVNPGGSLTQVEQDADAVVTDAAKAGASLKIFLIASGSAASMVPVELPNGAGSGNFFPNGANDEVRRAQSSNYASVAIASVNSAIEKSPASRTGADLLGALRKGIDEVRRLDGVGLRTVVLVTYGGVHRAAGLDLIATRPSEQNARQLARRSGRIEPPFGVAVDVRGVGRFEGAEPPIDPGFANGVVAFWHAVCARCDVE